MASGQFLGPFSWGLWVASSAFFSELTVSALVSSFSSGSGLQFPSFSLYKLGFKYSVREQAASIQLKPLEKLFYSLCDPEANRHSLRVDPPVQDLALLRVLVPSSSFLLQRCPDCFYLKINASFFPYRLTTFLPWLSYIQGREKCLPAALLFTIHLFLPHLYGNFSHGLLKIERK